MDDKKINLHSSYDERKKQKRKTDRVVNWGAGVKGKPKFELSLLNPRYIGIWLSFILLYVIVKLLPFKYLIKLGSFIGSIMYKYLKGRRYVTERNFELAFPNKSKEEKEAFVKDVFKNAGIGIFETGIAWFYSEKSLKKIIDLKNEDIEKIRTILQQHKGTIAMTCHFVNLEIGARAFGQLIQPGVGVYRASDHPVIEYMQLKGRLVSNEALVDRRDPRSIVKCLLKGYVTWYAPDQDYGIESSSFAPFFAVENTATINATRNLAKLKNVTILPFFIVRENYKYKMYFYDVLTNFPTDNEKEDLTLINKIIEKMILTAPTQYLWMHRRFKTKPEGESDRYPKVS